MSKQSALAATSIGLFIDQCLREIAYSSDQEAAISYAAMCTGMDTEELKQMIRTREVSHRDLYADH